MRRTKAALELVFPNRRDSRSRARELRPLTTIDLFCGAGGITEGFREAGFKCLYANDLMPEAISTFSYNHPGTWADCRSVEKVKPAEIRAKLRINKGDLDVLVGGPPVRDSQLTRRSVFSLRVNLFKDCVRFHEEASL